MPRIAVVFTGGTISMRDEPDAPGNRPTLRGEALMASVPGLADIAEIEPIDWGLVPASHLTFEQVLEIGRILARALDRPDVDGTVVVQGTDVIEETAFAWDLLPLPAKPVVVVGAMRSASQEGYDGPENLRNAVAVAADPSLAGQGVVVAMAGEIHAADDVRKTHTHAYATFQSPNTGRLGLVADGRVTLLRRRQPLHLPRIPASAALPVPILGVALDDAPRTPAAAAGLVVAAAGGGNTPPAYLEVARELLAAGVPVALTTRCPSGRALPGYGFPGGSSQWWDAGAIFTGTLDALKARVLLALGVGAGLGVDELAGLAMAWGGGRIGAAERSAAGSFVTAPVTNGVTGDAAALVRVLLHLATAPRGMATSAEIGEAVGIHPVVVRRMLGALRPTGMVESRRGAQGGWALARDPSRIRLGDVSRALAAPGSDAHDHVSAALRRAEEAQLAELDRTTLADLMAESTLGTDL